MSPEGTIPAPVAASERISSLDVIRGVAVLGILAMNIIGFAFHTAVYADPTVQGGATGANLFIYVFNSLVFDGKMRGIFSMLFGAGVLLMTTRLEAKGSALPPADIHYRRMLWLLLFGIAHAFLLWWGEILYPYALLGLALYPFRRMSPRGLLIMSAGLLLGTTLFTAGMAFDMSDKRDKALAAEAAAAKGAKLTDEQIEEQRAWKEKKKEMKPDAAELRKTEEAFRGGFGKVMEARARIVMMWHSIPYYSPMMWDLLGMMILGMALLKTRVLAAERSWRFYATLAAAGYAIGLPVHAWMNWRLIGSNFDLAQSTYFWIPYQPARVAVCLAHVAVVMMIVKAGILRWLTSSLAACGQMAFSNYVAQSVICSTIFYGYGLGMFARLERYQVYYVVAAIWLFQMITSPIWLRYFRFGPLEWCWRSLTYWKRQPMRLAETAPAPDTITAPA